jgi:hypothetical protein
MVPLLCVRSCLLTLCIHAEYVRMWEEDVTAYCKSSIKDFVGLKKTTKPCEDSRYPGRDPNLASLEYEAELITTNFRH